MNRATRPCIADRRPGLRLAYTASRVIACLNSNSGASPGPRWRRRSSSARRARHRSTCLGEPVDGWLPQTQLAGKRVPSTLATSRVTAAAAELVGPRQHQLDEVVGQPRVGEGVGHRPPIRLPREQEVDQLLQVEGVAPGRPDDAVDHVAGASYPVAKGADPLADEALGVLDRELGDADLGEMRQVRQGLQRWRRGLGGAGGRDQQHGLLGDVAGEQLRAARGRQGRSSGSPRGRGRGGRPPRTLGAGRAEAIAGGRRGPASRARPSGRSRPWAR